MAYQTFDELKKNVSEVYASIAHLLEKFDWGFFSEEGSIKVEVYEILDDCFRISTDKTELALFVSTEIHKLDKGAKELREAGSLQEAEEKSKIVRYLARYIRHNCEEEHWSYMTAFDYNHYKRGC